MHYYKFNIKDWTRDTAHLSVEEEGVYRRLLDHYYESESPIPAETKSVIRRLRMGGHEVTVMAILAEFFMLDGDVYRHARCDFEIAKFHGKAEANRENGRKGGRPAKAKENPDGFESEPKDNLNHQPPTTNQEEVPNGTSDQQAESPDVPIRIPYAEILACFQKRLPNLPQPRDMTDKRRKRIKAIWTRKKSHGSVDFFDRYFEYVAKSNFLMGRTKDPWGGCTFDWLINPENFIKVVEGNYENKEEPEYA